MQVHTPTTITTRAPPDHLGFSVKPFEQHNNDVVNDEHLNLAGQLLNSSKDQPQHLVSALDASRPLSCHVLRACDQVRRMKPAETEVPERATFSCRHDSYIFLHDSAPHE